MWLDFHFSGMVISVTRGFQIFFVLKTVFLRVLREVYNSESVGNSVTLAAVQECTAQYSRVQSAMKYCIVQGSAVMSGTVE